MNDKEKEMQNIACAIMFISIALVLILWLVANMGFFRSLFIGFSAYLLMVFLYTIIKNEDKDDTPMVLVSENAQLRVEKACKLSEYRYGEILK